MTSVGLAGSNLAKFVQQCGTTVCSLEHFVAVGACRIEALDFMLNLGCDDFGSGGTACGLHQEPDFFGAEVFGSCASKQPVALITWQCPHDTVDHPRNSRMALGEKVRTSDGFIIREGLMFEPNPLAATDHGVVGERRIGMGLQVQQEVTDVPRRILVKRACCRCPDNSDFVASERTIWQIESDVGCERHVLWKLPQTEDSADFASAVQGQLGAARWHRWSFTSHTFGPPARHYCHTPIGMSTHHPYQRLSTDTYKKVYRGVDTASEGMLPNRYVTCLELTISEQR